MTPRDIAFKIADHYTTPGRRRYLAEAIEIAIQGALAEYRRQMAKRLSQSLKVELARVLLGRVWEILDGKGAHAHFTSEAGQKWVVSVIAPGADAEELARLIVEKVTAPSHRCTWCGHQADTLEAIREHVGVCEKHPAVIRLRELEADRG